MGADFRAEVVDDRRGGGRRGSAEARGPSFEPLPDFIVADGPNLPPGYVGATDWHGYLNI